MSFVEVATALVAAFVLGVLAGHLGTRWRASAGGTGLALRDGRDFGPRGGAKVRAGAAARVAGLGLTDAAEGGVFPQIATNHSAVSVMSLRQVGASHWEVVFGAKDASGRHGVVESEAYQLPTGSRSGWARAGRHRFFYQVDWRERA